MNVVGFRFRAPTEISQRKPGQEMSKHRKPTRSRKTPAIPAARPGIPRATFIVLGLAGVTALGFWLWQSKPKTIPPTAPPPAESNATNPSPADAVAKLDQPAFQKLIGKWQRTDGVYVVEIRSVDGEGKLDAAYYNPKSINVARTQAAMDGTALRVFIELRDVNYPGSTYTLTYGPAEDQLSGIYYQALQQQSFEVAFVRMK